MMIRIIPPTVSAHFPASLPSFYPNLKAVIVTKKEMSPIIPTATVMSTSRNAKVKPTASASMLVATASKINNSPLVKSVVWESSPFLNDS